jgi:peroxiredoxin Q/BCP
LLSAGTRAPEFTLPNQDGTDISLSGLLRQRLLVLYFYPADFTPGCTREACTFRDMHHDILDAGLAIAGVSPQSPESHRKFRDKYQLPFPLLSDADKSVTLMYEVNGLLGFGVRRATFLIDPKRMIRDALLADFRVGAHEAFVRRALAAGGGGR